MLPADFDGDGQVGLIDIDLLGTEIARGTHMLGFDLTSDKAVARADLTAFLSIANRLNGDLDFDGEVQFSDFVVLANHFGETDQKWSAGDLDVNGEVQFADFVILADAFGMSVVVAPVPETHSGLLAFVGTLVACSLFRTGQGVRGDADGV
jgi:hypothetical protein